MNKWEQIKSRINCRQIAAENGVDLTKKKSVCPFCNYSKNASFSVMEDFFKCFHCDKKGDVFSLVAAFNESDRFEAFKFLAKRTGVNLILTDEDRHLEEKSETFKKFLTYFAITNCESETAQYLISRGFTLEFIQKKLIAYVPPGFDESRLPESLKGNPILKHFKMPEHFQGRIIFPYWKYNQVIYMAGRKFEDIPGWWADGKKYLNLEGDKTYIGVLKGPELILTEGVIDQLLAEQKGINCIGLSGTTSDIKIHKGINEVIILIEGDNAGLKNREQFSFSMLKQGASVKIAALPDKKDFADFLCEGGNLSDLNKKDASDYFFDQLSESPRNQEKKEKFYKVIFNIGEMAREFEFQRLKELWKIPIAVIRADFSEHIKSSSGDDFKGFQVPDGYIMTDGGILFEKTRLTYTPFYINAVGNNDVTGKQFIEVVWNENSVAKKRIVSRQTLAAIGEIISLSSYGAPVTAYNALNIIRFIDAFFYTNLPNLEKFEVVSELGWYKDNFIMPGRIIGKNTSKKVFYQGSINDDAFGRKGDIKAWIAIIKRLAPFPDAHLSRFCLYSGFASIVLERLDIQPIVIHLCFESSKGKTTCQRLAASIYGEPTVGKAIFSWNATDVSIIRIMENLRHLPLVIDELTGETFKNLSALIYAISSGMSRLKGDKNDAGGVTKFRSFRNLVISSGEKFMLEDMSNIGENVRVWEIDCHPFGFNDENFITDLKNDLLENHGLAVDYFVKNLLELGNIYKDADNESFFDGDMNALTNPERRVMKMFDVIYLTGLIVEEIFKFGFNVKSDIQRIFELVRKPLRDKSESASDIIDEVRGYVEINKVSFPYMNEGAMGKSVVEYLNDNVPLKIYGYLYRRTDGGLDLAFHEKHFKDFIAIERKSRTSAKSVLNILRSKGIILNRDKSRRRVNGGRPYFVYFDNFYPHEANPEIQESDGDLFG